MNKYAGDLALAAVLSSASERHWVIIALTVCSVSLIFTIVYTFSMLLCPCRVQLIRGAPAAVA